MKRALKDNQDAFAGQDFYIGTQCWVRKDSAEYWVLSEDKKKRECWAKANSWQLTVDNEISAEW